MAWREMAGIKQPNPSLLLMDVLPFHLQKLYALEHFLHEALRKESYDPFP
jgi:hypothetical protein